jgi:hypothetical protein
MVTGAGPQANEMVPLPAARASASALEVQLPGVPLQTVPAGRVGAERTGTAGAHRRARTKAPASATTVIHARRRDESVNIVNLSIPKKEQPLID